MKRIITFSIIILLSLSLTACAGKLSEDDISKLVTDNFTLLEESIKALKPLDEALARISLTGKEPVDVSSGVSINGLYCCIATQGLYVKIPLYNKIIEETMNIDGLLAINLTRRSEYVDYFCGLEGLGPDFTYYGFYYSCDGEPCYIGGDRTSLEQSDGGWVWENVSGGYYSTKLIKDSWYFYENHI